MIINNINIDVSAAFDGIVVAVVGYCIVFIALVVLYYVYHFFPKIMNVRLRKKLQKQGKEISTEEGTLTGETNAAIAMALFLYFDEIHDEESTKMTIKKVSKTYSPWSSKLYGLNTYWR